MAHLDSNSDRIHTYRHSPANPVLFPLCWAEIRERKDYGTGKLSVKASVRTAPDRETVLQWPFTVEVEGYMTKTELRRERAAAKRELKEWLKAHRVVLDEPIREELL